MQDFLPDLTRLIQRNCDISDARDNGIYSLCILVLKLRNLYKWEKQIEPWDEPESAVVLKWIEDREAFWEKIGSEAYQPYPVNGMAIDPFDTDQVNAMLGATNLFYGAGYGRSLKSLFFLAEISNRRNVSGVPVIILGRETARELASPFAMAQDGMVIIRQEQMRFFFRDRLQEAAPSAKAPLLHALNLHGLLEAGRQCIHYPTAVCRRTRLGQIRRTTQICWFAGYPRRFARQNPASIKLSTYRQLRESILLDDSVLVVEHRSFQQQARIGVHPDFVGKSQTVIRLKQDNLSVISSDTLQTRFFDLIVLAQCR